MHLAPTFLAFFAILVAAIFSIELGISVAIFELLAGLTVSNLLHVQHIAVVSDLAQLGSLFLIFMAGAEVNTTFLKSHYRRSLALGVPGFLVPFLVVFATVFFLFPHWGLRSALVTATALGEISVAIVFTYLREHNMAATDLGRTILAATFVANFLVMVTLGVSFIHFSLTSLGYLVALAAAFVILPPLGHRFVQRYKLKAAEIEIRYVLVAILVGAYLAEQSQVQAAVSVFALGLFFSDILTDQLQTRLDAVGFGLLIPMFFFHVGLGISLGSITRLWWFVLALLVVVSLSRRLVVRFVANRLMPGTTSFLVSLTNARLTFASVVASFGLTAELISQDTYSVIIVVAFLTALIASLELRWKPKPDLELETPGDGALAADD